MAWGWLFLGFVIGVVSTTVISYCVFRHLKRKAIENSAPLVGILQAIGLLESDDDEDEDEEGDIIFECEYEDKDE